MMRINIHTNINKYRISNANVNMHIDIYVNIDINIIRIISTLI